MDVDTGVQAESERLVQSYEGAGDAAATAPARDAATSDTGSEREAAGKDAGNPELEGHPVQEGTQQDESVPPELRPDKDGNPPKVTPELLRQLRGKYYTVKHPFLVDCGHKLDMINEPRHRHCENCWWTWFNSHGPLVETADQMFRTLGPKAVEALRGKLFVKMFKRFMATVYHFQQELEKEKANESNNQPTEAALADGEEISGVSSGPVAE